MTASPQFSFRPNLHRIIHPLFDLLFPPQCVACNHVGAILCDHCAQAVESITQAVCKRCGRAQVKAPDTLCSLCEKDDMPVLTMARAAAFHSEPLRAIIHHFKYGNRPELAAPLSRYLLAAFAAPEWRNVEIDCIVPIPMFSTRQKERGYNQAELLAQAFCYHTQFSLQPHLLKRIRFTQAQVGLNARERQKNVEDVFIADPAIRGKSILLIDDVYTTGATLRSCATVARQNGARHIYALALAIPITNDVVELDSFPA